MKIALISADPSFGNAPGIFQALSTCAEVIPVFRCKDSKQMWKQIPDALYEYENIPEDVDQYVIVAAQSYVEVWELLFDKPIRVILTDSYYLKNYKKLNGELRQHIVYCMPCLKRYYGQARSFYHPFEWEEQIIKNDVLTISHSPSNAPKRGIKGTAFIDDVIKEIKEDIRIQYDLITDEPWLISVQKKSCSHIFIDQVVDEISSEGYTEVCSGYKGGLG